MSSLGISEEEEMLYSAVVGGVELTSDCSVPVGVSEPDADDEKTLGLVKCFAGIVQECSMLVCGTLDSSSWSWPQSWV